MKMNGYTIDRMFIMSQLGYASLKLAKYPEGDANREAWASLHLELLERLAELEARMVAWLEMGGV